MSELDAGAIRPMAVTAERDRNRYLRSESAFDVLKKALRIYRQHFGLLLITLILPVLPFDAIELAGLKDQSPLLFQFGTILKPFALVFAFSAVSVVGAD